MEISTVILGISAAIIGATITAIYNILMNREKIWACVTSIELSSRLLSRIDQVIVPDKIAVKFRQFGPWVRIPDIGLRTENVLSVGAAQKHLYYVKAFLDNIEESSKILQFIEENTGSGDAIRAFFQDLTLRGLFLGMSLRGEMPFVSLPNDLPPCIVEYEEGNTVVGNHEVHGYHVNTMTKYCFLHYTTNIEKSTLINSIKSICHNVKPQTQEILARIRSNLSDARVLASEIEKWLEQNLDKNSTIIISVAISNLGKTPILLNNFGVIRIHGMDGDLVEIPCVSEDFNIDSSSEKAASNIIQFFVELSSAFGISLNVRNRIPLDKMYIDSESQRKIVFRSVMPINGMKNSESILSYYKTSERRAEFEITYFTKESVRKGIVMKNVIFGSNLDLAERATNTVN